jgi:hypothetical protein
MQRGLPGPAALVHAGPLTAARHGTETPAGSEAT